MAGNPSDEPRAAFCSARPKRPCLCPDATHGLDGGIFQAPTIPSPTKETKRLQFANFTGDLTDNQVLLQHILSYLDVLHMCFHHSICWTNYFSLWYCHIDILIDVPKAGFPTQLSFWVSNCRSTLISDFSMDSEPSRGSARRASARKSFFAQ